MNVILFSDTVISIRLHSASTSCWCHTWYSRPAWSQDSIIA